MNLLSRVLKITFFICLTCWFTACEDDPILEGPNNGNTAGGSYGRLGVLDSTGRFSAPPVIYNPNNPKVF